MLSWMALFSLAPVYRGLSSDRPTRPHIGLLNPVSLASPSRLEVAARP